MATTEPPAPDLDRVLVVSPHLDDAVLGAGHLIAGAHEALVLTIFAGVPGSYPTDESRWDCRCGFSVDDDVVSYRRRENLRALEALQARGVDLDLLDAQYRGHQDYRTAEVSRRVGIVLAEWQPTAVVVPLGTGHRDHRLASAAGLRLRRETGRAEWVCYAEFPYAWREADAVVRRLSELRRKGYRLTPVLGIEPHPEEKAAAVRSYESQLDGLELRDWIDRVASAPEQIWRLDDRPPLRARAKGRLERETRTLVRRAHARAEHPFGGTT